jgi:Fe-S-cluster-containing dehydrogenase component
MAQYGLLIDYEYCTGCHSCEVACKEEKGLPLGKWGIKVLEDGPWQATEDKWVYNFVPVPTLLCDLCHDLVEKGKEPTCVHHCLAKAIEYGPLAELCAKMESKGKSISLFVLNI